nr:hypothetical protein Iba_chr01dCG1970 [Ipomoea batatas]
MYLSDLCDLRKKKSKNNGLLVEKHTRSVFVDGEEDEDLDLLMELWCWWSFGRGCGAVKELWCWKEHRTVMQLSPLPRASFAVASQLVAQPLSIDAAMASAALTIATVVNWKSFTRVSFTSTAQKASAIVQPTLEKAIQKSSTKLSTQIVQYTKIEPLMDIATSGSAFAIPSITELHCFQANYYVCD